MLKSVWYGVVKCVLQGLRVEKCVVRCTLNHTATFTAIAVCAVQCNQCMLQGGAVGVMYGV